jgi:type II secretory pathway pseudopilin PulG
MQRQKGFLPIELLILVAIIVIIAAITIPNLLRAPNSMKLSRIAQLRTTRQSHK